MKRIILMENKVLIIVDYTYDFIATDGKLTCGTPGQLIESNIVTLAEKFRSEKKQVIIASDKHELNDPFHPETKLFPPHNIVNTKGRDLYGKLSEWYNQNKNNTNVHFMDKTRYSAFAGTDLDIFLRARNISEIHISGVCTDICVLHTLVDAYNLGYKMVVNKNTVASFNPTGHEWALEHFKNVLNADVI